MLMYDTVYSLSLYRGDVVLDCTRQVYNLGNGGSQFTMTLWMGYGQTTKNDNGDGPHSRFPGFVHIPSTGSW